MPTIAELLAARKAAASPAKADPPARPTTADLELEEAINRIDPPQRGKRRAGAGMVLSAKTPPQPAEIAKKAHHAEMRSLSRSEGEAIPLTPCNADKEETTWHEAMNAFESALCVMRDPQDSDVVWLAIRPDRAGLPPILIHRLPWILWDYPHPPTDKDPF